MVVIRFGMKGFGINMSNQELEARTGRVIYLAMLLKRHLDYLPKNLELKRQVKDILNTREVKR